MTLPIPVNPGLAARHAKCAELGHPGCTHNEREARTWCLCGTVTYPGDQAIPHLSCCGGPLDIGRSQP